jgi:hypothetical protein
VYSSVLSFSPLSLAGGVFANHQFRVLSAGRGGPAESYAQWPDGGNQPLVSTLNAQDGAVTSNMAIVPAGKQNGKVDAYADGLTQLIFDISSYFAP